jgi:hypothetical protein
MKKKAKQKLLKKVCLHCMFLKAHHDKWPDWKPTDEGQQGDGFQDLVGSTIKIVAEVFTMLDEEGRMQFYKGVDKTIEKTEALEALKGGKPISFNELLEKLRMFSDDKKPPEPVKH